MLGLPRMGVTGAAVATVAGQLAAAAVVFWGGFRPFRALSTCWEMAVRVYRLGIPNILMQGAYTFYILGLNLILSTFSDQAVTALGLYYKWMNFFFIPLGAMQACMVPIISCNYASGNIDRCRKTLREALLAGLVLMLMGMLCFELIPGHMPRLFSQDPEVIAVGTYGSRWMASSFPALVTSLIFPVFFQAVGYAMKSSMLTILRTMVLFVPLGWFFSRLGLHTFWLTYPITELVATAVGFYFYRQFIRRESGVCGGTETQS